MGRTKTNRVESFPSLHTITTTPSSLLQKSSKKFFEPKHVNLRQVHRVSADHLCKVLDVALKHAIVPNTVVKDSDCHFINCYLDSTVLLLDACSNLQLRLGNIWRCINSIQIGLHCLEGEQEQSSSVLKKVTFALQSSCLSENQEGKEMEKSMPNMRNSGKKLILAYQNTNGHISPEFYRALRGCWATAVLAVGELGSALSFNSKRTNLQHKVKQRKTLKNKLSKKIKFPKKLNEVTAMEELKAVDITTRTLLKLVLALQNAGGGSIIRRMAVRVVAGELRRKTGELEKTLPELEEKVCELCRSIIALRMWLLGLPSEVQKEEDDKPVNLQEGKNWAKFQTKLNRRACSLGRIGPVTSSSRFSVKPSSV